uniref:Uncharacterized protein n=1 Tax=Salix viminalis TaxID=40686 RepID=A0A6N2N7M0_SALVM
MEVENGLIFTANATYRRKTSCMLLTMPAADARAPVRCPRMIDCGSVCQGFPYKCVDGKCICGGEVFPRPPASIRQ